MSGAFSEKGKVVTLDIEQEKPFVFILALLVVKVVTQNEQLFFVLSLVAFVWIVFRGARFHFPPVLGLVPFIALCVLYTFLGFLGHDPRNVIRDAYYIFPSFLWMMLAYMLATNRSLREGRSMLKTLYLYGALVSISCYVRFALGGDVSFNGVRHNFVSGVYDVGFIIPVLAYHLFVRQKVCFSCFVDVCFLLLMVSQVALSFGRISIAEPVICLSIMLIVVLITRGVGGGSSRILALLAGVLISVLLVLWFMPESTTAVLIDKIGNVFSEVDASSTIKSTEEAMNNWRGYEIQCAMQQWSESPWHIQFFGAFLGEGIRVDLIPYNWIAMVENNSIPLLHNGFMTLLPKTGILGLALFSLVFLSIFARGVFFLRTGETGEEIGAILISLAVASVFVTYVVRGPISEQTFFVWAVLVGWLLGCGKYLEVDNRSVSRPDLRRL